MARCFHKAVHKPRCSLALGASNEHQKHKVLAPPPGCFCVQRLQQRCLLFFSLNLPDVCLLSLQAALRAREAGSTRFCMGAAWRGPTQVRHLSADSKAPYIHSMQSWPCCLHQPLSLSRPFLAARAWSKCASGCVCSNWKCCTALKAAHAVIQASFCVNRVSGRAFVRVHQILLDTAASPHDTVHSL